MENKVDTELIIKYIAGLANEAEKGMVLDFIEQNEENKKKYSELKNYWVASHLKSIDRKKEEPIIELQKQKPAFRFNMFYRVAAMLVVIISLFGVYYLLNQVDTMPNRQNVATFNYMVNTGLKGMVVLPDGSRVWLNSSSSLQCPEKFDRDKRLITLDGEGYFEVAHNKKWPMYVKTSKGYTVKVTGTSFNLSSYSDDDRLVVTLISGEITMLNNKNKKETKLKPTQSFVALDSEKEILVNNANIEYNTAWKDGYLLFENAPMGDVIKKLERWYGVHFEIKDTSLLNFRFTANFKSESITKVLEILKLSSNIGSKINDTKITLTRL